MDIPVLNPKSLHFPDVHKAIARRDGLVAVGGDLRIERLLAAYVQGIFPWYSDGQPICWWALSPRTVETHRTHLMRKLEAGSLAELIRCYGALVDAEGP